LTRGPVPSAATSARGAKHALANHEIVVLAVFVLGGDTSFIDTEDVAVKADELAPRRFAWRKYPDQINLEHVRVFLTDAKKAKNGALIVGSNRNGWMLSERGLGFAQKAAPELGLTDLSRVPRSSKERAWHSRERARILALFAEREITPDRYTDLPLSDVEAAFRLDDYVTGDARERVVIRYLNTFADDTELGPALRILAARLREA